MCLRRERERKRERERERYLARREVIDPNAEDWDATVRAYVVLVRKTKDEYGATPVRGRLEYVEEDGTRRNLDGLVMLANGQLALWDYTWQSGPTALLASKRQLCAERFAQMAHGVKFRGGYKAGDFAAGILVTHLLYSGTVRQDLIPPPGAGVLLAH